MRFGFMPGAAVGDGIAHRDYTRLVITRAEELGFESAWVGEHVVFPDPVPTDYPYSPDGKFLLPPTCDLPDPLTWLAHVSGFTSTIKLATGALVLPQRNPVVLAKELATLDRLSGGRLLLGVGVGWMRQEAEAIGVPFSARGRRLEEFIGAMRSLWVDDLAEFEGEHVNFQRVRSYPKPAQKDQRVPIIIGGGGPIGARRAGRLGDGYYPLHTKFEDVEELVGVMRKSAAEAGRNPADVEVSVLSFAVTGDEPVSASLLDEYRRMEELGVQRIVIARLFDDTTPKAIAALERLEVELLKAF
jgi:probable F420-dependent oxidoreductase